MLTLTLTRHGETIENQQGILQGHMEGHLNQTGIEQAGQLRDRLAPTDFDIIVCSDLERTRLTAKIINEKLHLPIAYTSLLRERDWGEFTGTCVKNMSLSPSEFPPSAEKPEQLAQRATHFLAYLLNNYDGKRVLGVGHGYFNRCIQACILQCGVRETRRWDNAETRTFEVTPEVLSHTAPTDHIISEN